MVASLNFEEGWILGWDPYDPYENSPLFLPRKPIPALQQVHALRSAESLAQQRQEEHQQQRDEAQEELAARCSLHPSKGNTSQQKYGLNASLLFFRKVVLIWILGTQKNYEKTWVGVKNVDLEFSTRYVYLSPTSNGVKLEPLTTKKIRRRG